MTNETDLEGAAGLDAMRDAACVVDLRETPVARAKRLLTPDMRRCLIELSAAPADNNFVRRHGQAWRRSRMREGGPRGEYREPTLQALWGELLLEVGRNDASKVRSYWLTERGREVGLALAAEEASDG